MEQFKQYVVQNWSTILEWVVIYVIYFLFFLYDNKVRGTKTSLSLLFKEKAQDVANTDIALRKDVGTLQVKMSDELTEAKNAYNAAVAQIADLKQRLTRTEKALVELMTDTINTIDTVDTVAEVELTDD